MAAPIVSHTPNTTNGGVEVAPNIGAIGVRASVTVAIVRGVAVPASKTDNRTRVMRIAVHAIVRRSRSTAAPAAPGGFGCDDW